MFKLATNYYSSGTSSGLQNIDTSVAVKKPESNQTNKNENLFAESGLNTAISEFTRNNFVLDNSKTVGQNDMSKLSLANQNAANLGNSLQKISDEVSNLSDCYDKVNGAIAESQGNIENYKNQIDFANSEIQTQQQYLDYYNENKQLSSQESGYDNQVKALDAQISSTTDQSQKQQLRSARSQAKSNLDNVKKQKKNYQNEATLKNGSEASAKIQKLKQNISQYREKIQFEKLKLTNNQNESSILKKQMDMAKTKEADLKTQVLSANVDVNSLQSVVDIDNEKISKDKEKADLSKNLVENQTQQMISLQSKNEGSTRKSNLSLTA